MTIKECTKFPCYGKSKNTGAIVKFTGRKNGYGIGEVIHSGDEDPYVIGVISKTWNCSAFIIISRIKNLKYNKW